MQLMDGINEAADSYRYLRRMAEEWAPLYQNISTEKVQMMLPGLLSNVRTMQTVCRCVYCSKCKIYSSASCREPNLFYQYGHK